MASYTTVVQLAEAPTGNVLIDTNSRVLQFTMTNADLLTVQTTVASLMGNYVSHDALDTLLGTYGTITPTTQPPQGDGMLWDDFNRADCDLSYTKAPSGHRYLTQYQSGPLIRSGRMVRPDTSKIASDGLSTLYGVHKTPPRVVIGNVVFTSGAGSEPNMVICSCKNTLGKGAIQFALYTNHVQLFKTSPTLGYVPIQTINFTTPLVADGATQYRAIMIYNPSSGGVRCIFPAGDGTTNYQIHDFTDSDIPSLWGCRSVWQLRHDSDTSGGEAQIVSIASGGELAAHVGPQVSGRRLRLEGDTESVAICDAAYTPGDMDVRAYVTPDSWASGADQAILSQWHIATYADNSILSGQLSWALDIGTTGTLYLRLSTDGQTVNGIASSVALPYTSGQGMWVRATRTYTDSKYTYYYSLQPPSTDPASVTWVQLGSVRTQGSVLGVPWPSTEPIKVGLRDRQDATTAFKGSIGYAAVHNGIGGGVVAALNLMKTWTGVGPAGETWEIIGNNWSWVLDQWSSPGSAPLDSAALTGTPTLAGDPIKSKTYIDTSIAAAVLGSLTDTALLGSPTVNGSAIAVGARIDQLLKPSTAIRETFPRAFPAPMVSSSVLASGVLYLSAIALLKSDPPIKGITFDFSTTAAVSPTNWWYCLLDANRNLLAITADQTTRAINSGDITELAIAQVASGAATQYQVTADGLYYLGIMVKASTEPSILVNTSVPLSQRAVAPKLCGSADSGLTTPPTFPFTAAAITANAALCYAYVNSS